MSKLSRNKGKRGERDCRDIWKKHGYVNAHRSQQFSGKGESAADIEGVDPGLHIEVKVGYSYKKIYDFMEQAKADAKEGQIPIVNCHMDRKEWLCVIRLDDFIELFKKADYHRTPDKDFEKCDDCIYAEYEPTEFPCRRCVHNAFEHYRRRLMDEKEEHNGD